MHVWNFTSGVYKGQRHSCLFGWFIEMVQCKGFVYGDPKKPSYPISS
jgi:hypothetical protein